MATFPRRVPSLHTTVQTNALGFTSPHIRAMQTAVIVMMPSIEYHIRKIAVRIFERYPYYLSLFRQTPPDNQSAHEFCGKLMNLLFELINHALDDIDMYNKLVANFVRYSVNLGLMSQDILNILGPPQEYMMEELERQMSNTLQDAIETFFDNIVVAFEKENQRQRTTMFLA